MKYVLTITVMLWAGFAYSTEPFKIYLSPTGNDNNDGLLSFTPIKTLNRAQHILIAADPDRPIEIHIKQGIYTEQSVVWRYTNGHTITFTPANFSNVRPVFDGNGYLDTWFELKKHDGTASHLKFRYLRVQNYNTAMSFKGNRNSLNAWNSDNELYGLYFYRIGGKHSRFRYSTAAVRFVNSRNNSVINSHFDDIFNDPAEKLDIHALYFAHYSSNNEVLNNKFLTSSGDPLKIRDQSNGNNISNNTFYSSEEITFYQEWYCNHSIRNDCTKRSKECPSTGNELRNNHLHNIADGSISVFNLRGDNNYCGTLSAPRLRTSGNVVLDNVKARPIKRRAFKP